MTWRLFKQRRNSKANFLYAQIETVPHFMHRYGRVISQCLIEDAFSLRHR